MAWRRIRHPSEMVDVGDEVGVRILKFDREKNRVSLGMKQLGDDPWMELTRRYPVGSRVFATVTNLTEYGCFAELEEGVEGPCPCFRNGLGQQEHPPIQGRECRRRSGGHGA